MQQGVALLKEVLAMQEKKKFPYLICGDFNCAPDTLAYNFLTKRELPKDKHYWLLTPEGHGEHGEADLVKVVSDSMAGEFGRRQPCTESDFKRMKEVEEFLETCKSLPKLESMY